LSSFASRTNVGPRSKPRGSGSLCGVDKEGVSRGDVGSLGLALGRCGAIFPFPFTIRQQSRAIKNDLQDVEEVVLIRVGVRVV
jgi:hypothetical protein